MSAPPGGGGGDMRRPHSSDGHVAGPGGMHESGPPPLIHLTGGKVHVSHFVYEFSRYSTKIQQTERKKKKRILGSESFTRWLVGGEVIH